MGALRPATVVVIPFPFSDLSASKLRPAVVLASASHGDWILCQVTSNANIDPDSVRLTNSDLQKGTLNRISYARPLKLFTANENIITKQIALLNEATFKSILAVTINSFQSNLP